MKSNIPLVIETDLGHDPDDFMAICYLVSAGVDIKSIFITPGDPDQIAIGKFLVDYLGINAKVYASMPDRNKCSSGGVHIKILQKYGYPLVDTPDDFSKAYDSIINSPPQTEFFVIGPPTALGTFFEKNIYMWWKRLVMQGGFIAYDEHNLPCEKLDKFMGKTTVPSFNPGGAIKQTLTILQTPIRERKFVSKNLCHTIVYDKNIHELILKTPSPNKAIDLMRDAMNIYLQKHDEKKFHDPTAAVLMLHPEIGTWVEAKLYCDHGKWGANIHKGTDQIIVDIDRNKLWEYVAKGE